MENFYTKKEVKKYCIQGENPNYHLHNFDVPFRALVIAPSGSEKSIFLTNLITLFCKGNIISRHRKQYFNECKE